ncbi:hypothetical protein, partial [Raoultibacter massiliensis]
GTPQQRSLERRSISAAIITQVKRIRTMALLMIWLAVLELTMSAGSAILFLQSGIEIQVVGTTDLGGSVVKINGGAIFMAAVLYCLSVFFEYGSLLQQLTDETM